MKEKRNTMTYYVEFEGFTQAPKVLSWGTVVVVAHNNRGKNEAGEWITTSTDYVDVIVPDGVPVPAEGVLVKVKGNLTPGAYLKNDGSPKPSLKVRAQDISPIFRDRDAVAVVKDVLGATPADEMPF
jgi:hypothetical protein